MDQHYSECAKHEVFWHTITWGEECPLCKIEKVLSKDKDKEIFPKTETIRNGIDEGG
jgi:hypothetical protein